MVLLASVTVPAMASSQTIYDPADYFYYQAINGDTKTLWFKFPAHDPYVKYFTNGELSHSGYYNSLYFTAPDTGLQGRFEVYPLGYEASTSIVPPAVVDVRSFDNEATISLTTNFDVNVVYSFTSETEGTGTLEYTGSWRIYMYDENFSLVSLYDAAGSTGSITLPETGAGIYKNVTVKPFSTGYSCRLMARSAYIVPVLNLSFVQPDWHDGPIVKSVSFQSAAFNLGINRNMIAEQTMLMQSIDERLAETNDQLGDLNDKADTIINGTDEQWSHAQDVSEEIQDVENDLDDQLSKLEELENWDTSTVLGTINDFLEADGWHDIRELLAPLLEWSHLSTMMLSVLAFAMLRFILLGR